VDGRRIDERLEGGADLAPCLCSAVELAAREVEAADHRPHLAGPIVDGQQRALDDRILLERDRLRHATLYGADLDLYEVTYSQEVGGRRLARPCECTLGELRYVRADTNPSAAVASLRRHGGHQRRHDIAL